jgi:predicted negative regulator of RcsB-dependent stress response
MTSNNKKFNQQLKRPDSFQVRMMGYLAWGDAHKVHVGAILGAVVLVGAGIFGWKYVQEKNSAQRREELAAIDFKFSEEAEAAQKSQQEFHGKVAVLDKKIESLGKDDKHASEVATLNAEKKSLESKIEEIKPQHDGSRSQYLAYYQAHKSSIEGWRAALQVATIAIEQEKYAEAAQLLQEVLPQAKGSYFYDMQIRATYISLLEEMGEWKPALAEADHLLSLADEGMKPRALLIKGRLLLLGDRKAEAKEIFKKIITEHNTSFEAGKAKAYLLL